MVVSRQRHRRGDVVQLPDTPFPTAARPGNTAEVEPQNGSSGCHEVAGDVFHQRGGHRPAVERMGMTEHHRCGRVPRRHIPARLQLHAIARVNLHDAHRCHASQRPARHTAIAPK